MKLFAQYLLFILILFSYQASIAENNSDSTKLFGGRIDPYINQHFEGEWFFGYRYSDLKETEINQFSLKRSYITFKHSFDERFDFRFTQDITLDTEGDDAGNIETRLKYCYLNVNLEDFSFVAEPYVEVGLVHTPWIEFEQKINPYRVQGTMFLDRTGILNSADFGFTFGGLFGGVINEEYRKNVSSQYPGKYGSFAIGVYNGTGYHSIEKNRNKTIEGRFTFRPFPTSVPGLQISYNPAFGKGNTEMNPDFVTHSSYLSYESRQLAFSAQYFQGRGNSRGSYADSLGNAFDNRGYSFFGEFRVPKTKLALFARYDKFLSDGYNNLDSQRFIGGISYYFFRSSKFVIDVDYFDPVASSLKDQVIYEAILEVNF